MENIIIDTDLGFDCDDGGVLVLANKLHKTGKVNILAVTHCVDKREGGEAIRKINEFYGNCFPVGVSDRYAFDVDALNEEFFKKLKYHEDFAGFEEEPSFYRLLDEGFSLADLKTDAVFPSSEKTIRQTLTSADDKSVVLVCIGQLNDLAKAVEKYRDLLKKKVKKIVIMCGNFQQEGEFFDDGETYWPGEFNVIMDISSAQTVFNDTDLPIDVLDYNQGVDILTGEGLSGQIDSPVYKMYKKHGKGKECSSWDPIAFLCASGLYEDYFKYSPKGKVLVENTGRTTFRTGAGEHRLICVAPDCKERIRNTINGIFAKV